jgi:hypothetical protein
MAKDHFHLAWLLSQGFGPKTWRGTWPGSDVGRWMMPDLFLDLVRGMERAIMDMTMEAAPAPRRRAPRPARTGFAWKSKKCTRKSGSAGSLPALCSAAEPPMPPEMNSQEERG